MNIATQRTLWSGCLLVAGVLAACGPETERGEVAAGMGGVGSVGGVQGGGVGGAGALGGVGGAGAFGGSAGVGAVGGTASVGGMAGMAGMAGVGGAGVGGVVDGGTGGAGGTTSHAIACNPINNGGQTTLTVNGVTRTYSVRLPSNTSSPMAVLFIWHGFMQQPATFANEIVYDVPRGQWVPFDPNAFPMPLMLVTPTSTNLLPVFSANPGLDWDISSGAADFPFFEGMLKCVHDQFPIDDSRVYSFGFSAGAVFTNLLSAKYPHLFAATISESGAWFNDVNQHSDVSIPAIRWNWPAFNAADGGNVLLTHGGPNDYATVISLESANQKALPFLRNAGRTVTQCWHNFGHTLDPDLTQTMYYDWMWAHQLGQPPINGLPAGFPTETQPVANTHCRFHAP